MSVYAKKNARGEPNGQWVVEVTREGKRCRETHMEFTVAKARELALLSGATVQLVEDATLPMGFTIGDLQKKARVIWSGTKDETQSLQRFDASMDLLGASTPVAGVYTQHLDELVTALRGRSLGDTTIHRYLCTVSAALRWACERHKMTGLQQMPVFPWKSLKKGEPRTDTLSPADDARLMEWLKLKGSPDIAVVMDMLLSTGMRIGELTKLVPTDFDRENFAVTIGNWEGRTKNGDRRKVPIPTELMERAYALALVGWPTYRRINSALHRARKALGITYVVTPHVMRHTVVTRLSKAKVPIMTIMDLVGHRSMSTTKGYNHTDMESLAEATESLTR